MVKSYSLKLVPLKFPGLSCHFYSVCLLKIFFNLFNSIVLRCKLLHIRLILGKQ